VQHRLLELDSQTAALLRNGAHSGLDEVVAGVTEEHARNGLTVHERRTVAERAFEQIRKILEAGNIPQCELPASLQDLLDTVAAALSLSLDLPPIIISFAAGTVIASSLRPASMMTTYSASFGPFGYVAEDLADSTPLRPFASSVEAGEEEDEEEETALNELRQTLALPSKPAAHAALLALKTRFMETTRPIWPLLAEFAASLIKPERASHAGKRKRGIEPRTAAAVVRHITQGFAALVEDEDPCQMPAAALEATHTEALQSNMDAYYAATLRSNAVLGEAERQARARSNRRKAAQALCRFQAFLDKYRDEKIDLGALGGQGVSMLVSAHLITLEQYQQARNSLQQRRRAEEEAHDKSAFLSGYAEALLILGFRLGLRRSEAHGLKVADVLDDWTFVRPSGYRGLKTANALRKLPHDPLVPAEELEIILQVRDNALHQGRSFLFSAPLPSNKAGADSLERPVHKGTVTDRVTEALQATGNKQLHFHHLRHSFASWTCLRLMFGELAAVPDIFPHLEQTTQWLNGEKEYKGEDCRAFRERLLRDEGPSRKMAVAVASLLGHSATETCTEHYIHFLDRLLGLICGKASS
jgi:integrase